MFLNFKSNKNLMAVKTTNNFGDQIIIVVDLSKPENAEQRKLHPYLAGEIVHSEINHEGHHAPFNEKYLVKKIMKVGA